MLVLYSNQRNAPALRRSSTTNINASIVDLRVGGIIEAHPEWFPWKDENKQKSAAFVVLCMSVALELPLEDCIELLTEGGNDAGVDGLYIDDIEEGNFVVTLFQGKYKVKDLSGKANFPETGLQASLGTLAVLFDPHRETALNERIAPMIAEIRSLILDGYIPTVRLVLCNNGARWTEQADAWVEEAKQEHGDQIEVLHFNHDAIVRSLQRGPHVDAIVTLNGGIVAEDLNFQRVLVGRIPVHELHRLFETHGDQLLERNIRRYLGYANNRINEDIRSTLLDPDRSPNFYFYNNGITMVCDRFDFNSMQKSDYQVQLKNVQVVNGGQTCKTIHETIAERGLCAPESSVLVRIYQLPGESKEVVREITKATNSQTPVDLRDLQSNDEWQKVMALGMKELGYVYKRHRGDSESGAHVVTSATTAEAVLAVWRERPHQAKFRRREHFGRLYHAIFKDLNASQALLASFILRAVEQRRKDPVGDPHPFLPYASQHIAMLIGRDLLRDMRVPVEQITHRNFAEFKAALERDAPRYYARATETIRNAIRACYGDRDVSLQQLAATFRRGDLLEMLPPDVPAA